MPILSNQCQYGVNPGSIFHPQPNFSIAQFMQFCKFANPIQSVPIRANLCQSEPRAKRGQSDNDNLPISCKNADISAVDNFFDNIAHPYFHTTPSAIRQLANPTRIGADISAVDNFFDNIAHPYFHTTQRGSMVIVYPLCQEFVIKSPFVLCGSRGGRYYRKNYRQPIYQHFYN